MAGSAAAGSRGGDEPRGTTRRGLLRASGGALAVAGLGTAAACAGPGGAGAGEKPGATKGPAVAKVLLMNNPVFTAVQADLVSAQTEADPGLRLDMSVFPGQI